MRRVHRTMGAARSRALRGACVLLLVGTALQGCGQSEDLPNREKASLAVDREMAMDTTPGGSPAPPSAATIRDQQQRVVSVQLREWEIETSRDTVPAGEITFEVMNAGTRAHALEVEATGLEEETRHIPPGATATLTLQLDPGTYELYCPIVDQYDHESRGMRAELVVRPASPTLMEPPGR